MQSWIFLASLLQSSVSHDPSEIILICWFTAQETFQIIINVENSCAASYFLFQFQKNSIYLKSFCNIINVFTVSFEQFNYLN